MLSVSQSQTLTVCISLLTNYTLVFTNLMRELRKTDCVQSIFSIRRCFIPYLNASFDFQSKKRSKMPKVF